MNDYALKPAYLLLALLLLLSTLSPPLSVAGQNPADEPTDIDQGQPLQREIPVSEMMAGLSDEQVRQLLLSQLKKEASIAPPAGERMKGPASLFHHILQILSSEQDEAENQFRLLWAGVPQVAPDLKRVFIRLCPYETVEGAVDNLLWVLLFLAVGTCCEALFRFTVFSRYFRPPPETGTGGLLPLEKILTGIIQETPKLLGLLIFFGCAYFSFMFFIWTDSIYVQVLFLAALIAICAIRVIAAISRVIFAPGQTQCRALPADCRLTRTAHRLLTWTFGYIILTLMSAVVIRRLGADLQTVRLLQLGSASLLLLATAVAIVIYRDRIREQLLQPRGEGQKLRWKQQQFASIWHILAISYLVILWLLLLNDLADPSYNRRGAFIPSFFIVPIWMVADRLVQWLVAYTMKTLQLHRKQDDEPGEPSTEEQVQGQRGEELYLRIKGIARSGVVAVMVIWVAGLWNIRIPLFSQLAQVALDTLIILTLAIVFWQFISSWIERKIAESIPEDEEEREEDEWGGAAARGRAYTLLPMVRKCVSSVLIVMVTMTILSSLGVDIGPLLAGAGVIGLAVGFGAQKLVADVFSGFFYLLDDAFRVGEYIEASTISGTVESITLRNAMIRHHRGMLQIIPHSDLGAITNYMRGGIIVKFNLDFPYDAPIDKIRKIIKKVGQRMLEDEEYGKDFIRPVKSQGVREITNSVMTIRVKFTAQPGTHFVIRREAYRLITEALNAQGIFYAHRKVIVDLPETSPNSRQEQPEKQQQLAKAAGAAALRAQKEKILEQEEKEDFSSL
ncbi:mechanosensitive ion channel family protein [Desulfogranum mediterraneum]|uniref:mechanosensitive ion channel family protein n=1 Tax=Desulfogranum mediterraneum TaxID=160661 RepID=UPI0004031124|nr:mechanosensitive ion channel family protein [Desulfogranum mediterraneum]